MFPGFVFCVICRDKWTMEHFLFLAGEECACSVTETNELTGKLFISSNLRAKMIHD